MTTTTTEHVHVAIAGTGFAGLGMAARLQDEGIEDFTLLERAHEVGGTWRDNTYPGCACDVPSNLYSFSFALNPDWSYSFSRQPEIYGYLRNIARQRGLYDHVRFGHEVLEACWDDDAQHWRITTSQGELTADVLVSGTGGLSEPKNPDIPGLETFGGKTFHSARWDHDHDLSGRRVAVIGTGASAIQFVPRIQPEVRHLTLFQRTPPWVLPRSDRRIGDRAHWMYRRVPGAQRAVRAAIYWAREALVIGFRNPKVMHANRRLAIRHLERQIPDPELRGKLTPDYELGCKRILISNDYYPSLTKDNVAVETSGIAEIRPNGIVTKDGTLHEVDTIIFGTGFHVTDLPISERIRGRDGRALSELWEGSPKAYNGTTVPGFPNLFVLVGPNTGLGHNSIVYMIEAQLEYVSRALKHVRATGAKAIEPSDEALDRWIAEVERLGEGTVWTAGGCKSWYLDETGRNSTLWPTFTYPFRKRMVAFDPAQHHVVAPRVARGRDIVAA